MARRIGALAWFAGCVLLAGVASGRIEAAPIAREALELTADTVEYEAAREIYVARGNVRIVAGDTELTADWMAFNDQLGRGVATGNVVYRAGADVLVAEFVEFNVETERGILFDGRFRSGENQFRMEGDQIVKRGDDSYSFEQGMFTTCRCPPGERDPWQIRAKSADLEVGGYGTARNSTFEILGVPVIWLPWMIYPLKTERESGLLLPEFAYGQRNGFDVGLPIFWAAGDSVNVTLTPRWLSKRGAKGDLDVEYVFGERSAGEVSGSFLYDQKIDPNSSEDPFDRERWQVHGAQDIHLPYRWRLKSDFQFVSDNEYLVDFHDLPGRRSDRFLESVAFVGRAFGADGRFGALASARYADDLQNPDDRDRDSVLLQRLPTVGAVMLPTPAAPLPVLSRLIPSFDAEYTLFKPRRRAIDKYASLQGGYTLADYNVGDFFLDTGIEGIPTPRESGYPGIADPNRDDFDPTTNPRGPELNGRFDEGELLADDGHRFDFFPRLALPFRIGDFVEAYPEVGWRQTVYDSHLQGTELRHLLTAGLDLRSRLIRRYDSGIVHLIEPRLGYALVSDLGEDQQDNPLFVPQTAVPQRRLRQLSLANVTLDSADRVSGFNGVTFGVANRIYGPGPDGGTRLLADFALSNEFRFDEGDFGIIFASGRAYPFEGTHIWANLGFDPEKARLFEAILQLGYTARSGHEVRLSYRYLRDVPRFFEDFRRSSDRYDDFKNAFTRINQVGLYGRLAITRQWAAYGSVAYSVEQSLLLGSRGGIEYTSKCRCWAAGFELSQDRAGGIHFNLVYRLLGMGKALDYRGPQNASLADLGLLDGI